LSSSSFGTLTAVKISAGEIESPILTALASNSFALASVSVGLDSRLSALENDLQFKLSTMLELSGGLSVNGEMILNGGLFVNSIGQAGDMTVFLSDVELFGRPYFNSDTAGFAMVPKGQKNVEIVFEQEYLDEPIVNANISLGVSVSEDAFFASDIRYLITKKTTKGFTIVINKLAPEDIKFNWISLAVRNAKTFIPPLFTLTPTPESSSTVTETSTPSPTASTSESPAPSSSPDGSGSAVTPSPLTTPETTPEITPEPSLAPTSEPTPELTPESTLESVPVPTPESTPIPSELP
jgi:hypothetical protein